MAALSAPRSSVSIIAGYLSVSVTVTGQNMHQIHHKENNLSNTTLSDINLPFKNIQLISPDQLVNLKEMAFKSIYYIDLCLSVPKTN